MKARATRKNNRGTTLLEVLIAVALLLIIFLFVTGDLIQSSQAENVSATRSASMDAANFFLGVMRSDPNFWSNGDDWNSPPLGKDPCGNTYPPYTDSITSPTWHPGPACASLFPNLVGTPTFQYMWNAQQQGADPDVAQLTVWVEVAEGGRLNLYELHSTRANIHDPPSGNPVVPTPPQPTQTASTSSPTPPGSPSPPASHSPSSPTPKPSPTPTKPPTPTPTPTPSGVFE